MLVALSGCSALVLLASALYTESVSSTGNTFTIGTIDIASTPGSAALTASGMVAGDIVTGSLQVNNNGSLALRYYAKSTTTENLLAAQLDLTVKVGVTTCTTAGFGASGTLLYGAADLGSTTGITLFGDPTQGYQNGDRTLAASGSETLCIRVQLPFSTGGAYEGLTTTATFDLVSEQTANNP